MATTYITKSATGIVIRRSGSTFTAEWKIGDANYDQGTRVKVHTKTSANGSWIQKSSETLTGSQSSYNFDMDLTSPLYGVKVEVQGRRGEFDSYTSSNVLWSGIASATFTITAPKKPSLSITNPAWPQTVFNWSVATDDTDNAPVSRVDYEAVLECDAVHTMDNVSWTETRYGQRYTGRGEADDALTVLEDSGTLSTETKSYIRCFRCRAYGPGGYSQWTFGNYIYAMPGNVVLRNSSIEKLENAQGYSAYMSAFIYGMTLHPVDQIQFQWAFAKPNGSLDAPADTATWTDGLVVTPYDDTPGAYFRIEEDLNDNQFAFLRAVSTHGPLIRYGEVVVGERGEITKPSGLVVNADPDTYMVQVTAHDTTGIDGARIAVVYATRYGSTFEVIGFIETGETTAEIQCPHWSSGTSPQIGVYSFVGTSSYKSDDYLSGATFYNVNAEIKSEVTTTSDGIPLPPYSVNAQLRGENIEVSWIWPWSSANVVEISWAEDLDAWRSTKQPQKFTVLGLKPTSWLIQPDGQDHLYIKVRLGVTDTNGNILYGPYSDAKYVNLASINVAAEGATLSKEYVTRPDETINVYFEPATETTINRYISVYDLDLTDPQGAMRLKDVFITSDNSVAFTPQQFGWQRGTQHQIYVTIGARSGETSSSFVAGVVAYPEEISCEIQTTDIHPVTIQSIDGEGDPATITVDAITELPITVTVNGSGENVKTTLAIERAADYSIERPDEDVMHGYAGETIYAETKTTNESFTIDIEKLIGNLDDGAQYILIATITDEYGQVATDERAFSVVWENHPTIPAAEIEIDNEQHIAIITPKNPARIVSDYRDFEPGGINTSGRIYEDTYARADRCREKAPFFGVSKIELTTDTTINVYVKKYDENGDSLGVTTLNVTTSGKTLDLPAEVAAVRLLANATSVDVIQEANLQIVATAEEYRTGVKCDIYRMSIDKPELIYQDAEFDGQYVDPYPTIGEFGGYRIVAKSSAGDYITANKNLAWYDEYRGLKVPYNIINIPGHEIRLMYNAEISNAWKKDFKETHYLGGSVQGDWNASTTKSGTISAVTVAENDQETIQAMRRLADYSGICHVRSKDGSSYDANVDVNEKYNYAEGVKTYDYTVNINRIDPEVLAGMTLEEWRAAND